MSRSIDIGKLTCGECNSIFDYIYMREYNSYIESINYTKSHLNSLSYILIRLHYKPMKALQMLIQNICTYHIRHRNFGLNLRNHFCSLVFLDLLIFATKNRTINICPQPRPGERPQWIDSIQLIRFCGQEKEKNTNRRNIRHN